MSKILDAALSIRRGEQKLSDIPARARVKVAAALQNRAALRQHADEKERAMREPRKRFHATGVQRARMV